jgi:hypothetical protein
MVTPGVISWAARPRARMGSSRPVRDPVAVVPDGQSRGRGHGRRGCIDGPEGGIPALGLSTIEGTYDAWRIVMPASEMTYSFACSSNWTP